MSISKILFTLSGIAILGIIFFLIAPVTHGGPCSCPPEAWMMNSVIKTLIENNTSSPAMCSPFFDGCTLAYYVIPLDLILVTIILAVAAIIIKRRNLSRV